MSSPGGPRRRPSNGRPQGGRPVTGRPVTGRPATGRPNTGAPGGNAGRAPRTPPRRQADPARLLAHAVLREVDARDAYANLVLPALLKESRLDSRERGFVTELAYGTLRARGTLDAVLVHDSSRPLAQIDPAVLDALRLGVYQLVKLRVPTHAAVAETVDLATAVAGRGAGGFVNAVLRSTARRWESSGHDLAELTHAPTRDVDPVGRLAVLHAHPRWIVEAFRDALGGDLGETERALAADDERPSVHLVARSITRDQLLDEARAAGLDVAPAPFSSRGVHLDGGDPGLLASVRRGNAGVQDEGSQLVALALAAAAPGAGLTLDMCAGPGGKAALLASLLPEATLLGLERAPARAGLVLKALRTTKNARVVVADAGESPLATASAGRVLLDAPCSGLGALRRRPEARWRKTPDDVLALHGQQVRLLGAAVAAAEPGAMIAYVTCSPHLHETRDVVATATGVEAVDARPFFPGLPDLGEGPNVQLWPHRHGTDAMFLALLRKL